MAFKEDSKRQDPSKARILKWMLRSTWKMFLEDQKQKITLNKYVQCPRCEGSGAEPDSEVVQCDTCEGKGKVRMEKQTPFGKVAQVKVCPDCGGSGSVPEQECKKMSW